MSFELEFEPQKLTSSFASFPLTTSIFRSPCQLPLPLNTAPLDSVLPQPRTNLRL